MSTDMKIHAKYGHIYIGFDKTKNESKVGMTIRHPKQRISETTNPDYALFHSYKIEIDDPSELKNLERKIHNELVKAGIVRRKFGNDKNSEWFKCKPEVADRICAEVIGGVRSKKQQETARHEALRKELYEESLRQIEVKKKIDEFEQKFGPTLKALEKKVSEHQEKLADKILHFRQQESSYEQNFSQWLQHLYGSIASSISWTLGLLPVSYIISSISDIYSFTELSVYIFMLIFVWQVIVFPSEWPFKKRVNVDVVNKLIGAWSNQSAYEEIQLICQTARNYVDHLNQNNHSIPDAPTFSIDKLNKLLVTNLVLETQTEFLIERNSVVNSADNDDLHQSMGRKADLTKDKKASNSNGGIKSGPWDWLILLIVLNIIYVVVRFILH